MSRHRPPRDRDAQRPSRHSGPPRAGRDGDPRRDAGPPRERAPERDAPPPRRGPGRGGNDGQVWLYGRHAVLAALANPDRAVRRLLASAEFIERHGQEIAVARAKGAAPPPPENATRDEIARRLTDGAVHQGIAALVGPLPEAGMDDLLARCGERAHVVALDQVTDPHNVGAILRSACAFGVTGIITTMRHSPEVTGVLAKAASGALEHVPIIPVQNLVRTLDELGEAGLLRVGLDSEAGQDLAEVALRLPMVLVLGAEGKGLRQSTRETCDAMARIELSGAIRSLNVSNAAAVTLYAVRQRLSAKM